MPSTDKGLLHDERYYIYRNPSGYAHYPHVTIVFPKILLVFSASFLCLNLQVFIGLATVNVACHLKKAKWDILHLILHHCWYIRWTGFNIRHDEMEILLSLMATVHWGTSTD